MLTEAVLTCGGDRDSPVAWPRVALGWGTDRGAACSAPQGHAWMPRPASLSSGDPGKFRLGVGAGRGPRGP